VKKSFISGEVVKVLLPIAVGDGYDYIVPLSINKVHIGNIVRIPLRNKEEIGLIIGIGTSNLAKEKIRPISSVIENIPPIAENLLQFMFKVSDYTMAPIGNILSLVIPESKAFTPIKIEDIFLFRDDWKTIWNTLSDARKTDAKKRIIECLEDAKKLGIDGYTMSDLSGISGTSTATIKGMFDAKILTKKSASKNPFGNYAEYQISNINNNIKLSDEQQSAFEKIYKKIDGFNATLIDGVTGSGKTEIYFRIITEILHNDPDKQVLIMLPEISLTAQFLQKFKLRFGIFPTLWHSGLTATMRAKNYAAITNGIAKIIVGTRSALFLPYKNLSFITVDEEHDGSYKQEEGVIYNARDMAVLRAKIENIPIVLASATPSIESYFNVEQKKYDIAKLHKRYSDATLPDIELINMKDAENKPQKNTTGQSWFAPAVLKKIENEIIAGNQVMIFLNRRGFAPLLLCTKCGCKITCPNCNISMVAHNVKIIPQQNGKNHISGIVKCHHCGYFGSIRSSCPACNCDENFVLIGPGVDRIKLEIDEHFFRYKSFVMSSDTINTSRKLNETITAIENREIDIIIGTQILSKGHHFPNLTLVVVVDGDMGIAGDDFRGAEKSFAMLHQVSGRAGREQKKGTVLIQTYNPEMAVMQHLKTGDKSAFITAEMNNRRTAKMPPFSRIAAIIISGKNKSEVENFCKYILKNTPKNSDKKFRILGPIEAPIAILNGNHRKRFLIQSELEVSMQKLINLWMSKIKIPANIKLKIDIDPYNFM
jgi:primosomal protein N' (replication factor Y)